MISLEHARDRILAALEPLPVETVDLGRSPGRVTADDVSATLDVPGFDNSAVDGYAVRGADTAEASTDRPVRLTRIGSIAAGDAPTLQVGPGQCVRILTGAALPSGADSVVMQEDVHAGDDGTIVLSTRVAPWECVRFTGEDVRRGTIIVAAGQRLRPAHVGLLAAAGVNTLPARRRPRVSLLSTGSELVAPGQSLSPGQLPDSNGPLLAALAEAAGAEVVGSRQVSDDLESTLDALRRVSADSDVIVTTGGVSVGDADLLKPALVAMGGTIELWRIALKPGKPFAWGRLGRAHWFGLPGNPVSAFVTWQLLVRPALRRLTGDRDLFGRRVAARLAEPLANDGNRLHALRVTLGTDGSVRSAGTQASHVQSCLAAADALLLLPPATSWEAGRTVEVDLFD